MSSDERSPHEAETTRDEPREAREQEAIAAFDPNDDGENAPPATITLDRYLSKRRPAPRMGWMQIISLLAMLGALIMIMVYKESCGQQISQLMGSMSDPVDGKGKQTSPRQKLPGVPVRLAPAAATPASVPASLTAKPTAKPASSKQK
ncbi:MAG: hypothetical protein CSA65_04850 [Proteobacteria bacterium]|nr:MAG: hypothetical protein CSB49_05130 [Pseudomonadota bacterium]PIE18448.1 MAG: hypothetical protein CSA65_04850 [Pseudomonadota bacterium]